MRSPSSPLTEVTANPIFLPSVPEMNPRTECGCQPVAFISVLSVAPPGRLTKSRTVAVLLPSRAAFAFLPPLGPLAPFLAGVAFFLDDLGLAGATRRACGATLAFLVQGMAIVEDSR